MRTRAQIKQVQRDCNAFTQNAGLGVAPLVVDGDKGHATRHRVKHIKWWLGFGRKKINGRITDEFLWQLHHPRRARSSARFHQLRVKRGLARRIARRKDVARNHVKAVLTSGVTHYDGVPVAKWLVPYLQWARENGWQGRLNSGWRDPLFSEKLCFQICGAPFCSGRCAGRTSNHVGSSPPHGALDVSDYVKFGELMRRCPLQPRIFNALGARDPVHFSTTGR